MKFEADVIFFTAFFFILWVMGILRGWMKNVAFDKLQMRNTELERENAGLIHAIKEHNEMVKAYKVGTKATLDILDAETLETGDQ